MLSFKYVHNNITLSDMQQIARSYNLVDLGADSKDYLYYLTTDRGCRSNAHSSLPKNNTACRYVIKEERLYTDIDLTIPHTEGN